MSKKSKELKIDIGEALAFREKMENIKVKFKDLFLNLNDGSKNSLAELRPNSGAFLADSILDLRKLGSPQTIE